MPSVFASHYAKATFGVAHRLRALRVKATGVMSNSSTGERSPAVGAPRSLRALRAAVCRPGGVLAPGHQHGAARIVLACGLWPCVWCLPRPPLWPRSLRGLGLARSAHPPPRGSLRTARKSGREWRASATPSAQSTPSNGTANGKSAYIRRYFVQTRKNPTTSFIAGFPIPVRV